MGIGDALKEFFSLLAEVFSFVPKLLKIVLWGLCGIIILPCVFVTHHFYTAWEDWGKEF